MNLNDERLKKIKDIRDRLLNFKESPLYEYRVANNFFPVVGGGDHSAKIMFVGEAPGKNEAKTGMPFCGASGKFLDTMLESVGLKRENVYITNIVNDRPQDNRDPSAEEIKLYSPFLDEQIEIIQPKVIVTLGRFSMEYIMKHFGLGDKVEPISKAHGKSYEGIFSYGKVKIIPLYHPAVALYNGSMRKVLFDDFKNVFGENEVDLR